MKKIFKNIFVFILFAVLCFSFMHVNVSLAQNEVTITVGNEGDVKTTDIKTVNLDNPLGDIKSPQVLVGQIINSLFGIIGSLALVMFIYGGFLWMTSAGSSEQVKKGKDIFIWAVVGLIVIFSAYSLVRFVIQGVGA